MLLLQFHVPFGCFYLVGAELSDSTAGKTWEASKPSLVHCIEPGGDWRSTHCHVVEVDKDRNSFDSGTVCFVNWLFVEWCLREDLLGGGVPPWKFAGVGVAMNVNHVKFSGFVKGTKKDGFTIVGNG